MEMNMTTKIAVLAALATTIVLGAFTPALADRVDQRQFNQQKRIEHGIRNGQLTPREAAKLQKDQREIRELERVLKSDGRLTAAERAFLAKEQNQAGRKIQVEKHDFNRPGRPWWKRRYAERFGYGFGSYRPNWW
jgi:hypothetical protein